jgi:hypothetical protein
VRAAGVVVCTLAIRVLELVCCIGPTLCAERVAAAFTARPVQARCWNPGSGSWREGSKSLGGKRHTAEPIISGLKQMKVTLAGSKNTAEVGQALGASERTYHRWRKGSGGMRTDHLGRRLLPTRDKETQKRRSLWRSRGPFTPRRRATSRCRKARSSVAARQPVYRGASSAVAKVLERHQRGAKRRIRQEGVA